MSDSNPEQVIAEALAVRHPITPRIEAEVAADRALAKHLLAKLRVPQRGPRWYAKHVRGRITR